MMHAKEQADFMEMGMDDDEVQSINGRSISRTR